MVYSHFSKVNDIYFFDIANNIHFGKVISTSPQTFAMCHPKDLQRLGTIRLLPKRKVGQLT